MRKELLTIPLALYALKELSRLSFSKSVRHKMIKRADGASEISGETMGPPDHKMLHCMHKSHTKDETYNDPERGLVVTVAEHLSFHLEHVGNSLETIGLSESKNWYAIQQLMNTDEMTWSYRKAELEEQLAETREAIKQADPLRQKRRTRV